MADDDGAATPRSQPGTTRSRRGAAPATPRSVLDDDELSVVSKEADVRVAKARAVRLLLAFEDGGTRPEPRGNQTSRRR